MAERQAPVRLSVARGVNTRERETDLPEGYVRDAVNVDLARDNAMRRRGWRQALALTNARSLFAHDRLYCVEDGTLTAIDPATLGKTALGTVGDADTSFCVHAGTVFLTNPFGTWRLPFAPCGITTPPLPQIAWTDGSLPQGWYQITMTAVRDGEESGAPAALLTQGAGGINATVPSGAVDGFRLYLSHPDDDTLRFAAEAAPGATALLSQRADGPALETQFFQPMPPGDIIRSYRGRLYIAHDDFLYWSDALRYGHTDPRNNWLRLPGGVTMMEPVEDGIYIGTPRLTLFLAGADPSAFQLINLDRRGVVPGSAVQAPPDVFLPDDAQVQLTGDHYPCWLDTDEVQVVGYPGGNIRRVDAPAHSGTNRPSAAGAYLEQRGIRQLLTVMRKGGGSHAASTDRVTSRVIPPD